MLKPRDFVREYAVKSLVCCFSGGKDSLAATHYVLSELEGLEDLDRYVVFVDTTVMLPVAVEYVKDVCARLGWPLRILRPEKSFWELAEVNGMPWIRRRWCCFALKLGPIEQFVKDLRPQRAEVVGLRHDESRKRAGLPEVFFKKRVWSWGYAPIIEWTEAQVLRYIRKHGLPMPPHYRMGFAETCMCGAFSSRREIMTLKAVYPEIFQKFVELEKRFQSDWTCFYFHRPVRAQDLAKQKTLTEGEFRT